MDSAPEAQGQSLEPVSAIPNGRDSESASESSEECSMQIDIRPSLKDSTDPAGHVPQDSQGAAAMDPAGAIATI